MRQLGRPRLEEGRLDANIRVLVTTEMRNQLIAEAERSGARSLGEFIRDKLMETVGAGGARRTHASQ